MVVVEVGDWWWWWWVVAAVGGGMWLRWVVGVGVGGCGGSRRSDA